MMVEFQSPVRGWLLPDGFQLGLNNRKDARGRKATAPVKRTTNSVSFVVTALMKQAHNHRVNQVGTLATILKLTENHSLQPSPSGFSSCFAILSA